MKLRMVWTLVLGLGACSDARQNRPPAPPNRLVMNYDPQLRKTDAGWLYKGVPFSGYMIETEPDQRIVYKLPIVAGLENGLARGWYNTGEKLLERRFVNGRREGLYTEWWPSGRWRYRFRFTDNQYDGPQLVFFPNGIKR